MGSPMAGTVWAALHANELTTPCLNVGNSVQDVTVNPSDHHLLAYLDATETTRVVATVTSDKTNYGFELLQVTRLDEARRASNRCSAGPALNR